MNKFSLIFFIKIFIIISCYPQSSKESIVLINIENSNKTLISKQIEIINEFNPRVIALDLAFPESSDGESDSILYHALSKCKELIMATTLEPLYDDKMAVVFMSAPIFMALQPKTGFVNSKLEEAEVSVPSQFITQHENFDGHFEYHFSVATAMAFDSAKTIDFLRKNQRIAKVDFRNGWRRFKVISASDVLKMKLTRRDIEGKIIMFGFLGPGNDDKFYSPLNKTFDKKDIYGLEYLAFIVSQIFNEDNK